MRILCPREVQVAFCECLLIASSKARIYCILKFYVNVISDLREKLQEQYKYKEFPHTLYSDFTNASILPYLLYYTLSLFCPPNF